MKFIQSFFHQQILLTILSLLTISKSATAATPSGLTSGLSGLELFFLLLASSCLGIGVYYLLGVVLSLLMRTLKAALDWLTETSQRSSLEQLDAEKHLPPSVIRQLQELKAALDWLTRTSQRSSLEQLDAEKHLPPSVIRQLQELEEYKDVMTTNEYAYQKHLIISKYVGGLGGIENERQSLMEARSQELIEVKQKLIEVKEAFIKAEWQNKVWRVRFTWVSVTALLMMVVAIAVLPEQERNRKELEAVLTRAERLQNKVAERERNEAKQLYEWERKVAERERNEAKQQYEIAFVQHIGLRARMAMESPSLVNGYVDQSFLLAVQAFRFLENLDTQSNLLHFSQSHSRLSKFLRSHRDGVRSVAFSPDGQWLASGSDDNSIILWDVKTGTSTVSLWPGHSKAVRSVAFSPDSLRLVSGSEDNSIILWDIKTGKAIGTPWQGHSKEVTSVAFSPDGLQLASGSYDNSIILWDVKTGTPIGTPWHGHNDFVNSVAFSPDGLRLASGGQDKSIILWDVKTGTPIGRQGPWQWRPWWQGEGVLSVAFSPDGLRLASGSWDNNIT